MVTKTEEEFSDLFERTKNEFGISPIYKYIRKHVFRVKSPARKLYDYVKSNPKEANGHVQRELGKIKTSAEFLKGQQSPTETYTCTTAADPNGEPYNCIVQTTPLTYCNFIQNEHSPAEGIRCPSNLIELYELVQEAILGHKKVRAVGNGHSYSDVSMTDGIVVRLQNLTGEDANQPSSWNKIWLAGVLDPQNYVSVLAGTRIRELVELLASKNKALSNLGGADVQTIAGALATGTHGSGLDNGCFSDYIRSLVLVAGNGKVIRLEAKSNPFTDETFYKNDSPTFLDKFDQPVPIELVQNDELFYSAIVGLGSLGIIYSMVLEVEESFYLYEDRELKSWECMRSIFDHPDQYFHEQRLKHLELDINPYKVLFEHAGVITRRFKYNQNEKPASFPLGYEVRGFPIDIQKNQDPKVIYSLFSGWRELIPLFLGFTIEDMQDRREGLGGGYWNLSPKVFNSGILPLLLSATGIEVRVPFHDARKFIDELLERIENLRKEGHYITSPIGIRFTGESNAYLSLMATDGPLASSGMDWGKVSVIVEIPSVISHEHPDRFDDDTFAVKELQHWAIGGKRRLHWGLSFASEDIDYKYLQTVYPNVKHWITSYKLLNPFGVFSNKFTKRLGLDDFLG